MTEQRAMPAVQLSAFLAALFLAPIFVAILGFWAVIPAFALIFGSPTYATFGAAFFYMSVRAGRDRPVDLALAGLAAHVVSLPLVFAFCLLANEGSEFFTIIATFGLIMAPLWGLMFGALYKGLRDD